MAVCSAFIHLSATGVSETAESTHLTDVHIVLAICVFIKNICAERSCFLLSDENDGISPRVKEINLNHNLT